MGLLVQDQPSEDSEEEEAYKLVPVRYKVKKGLPRSQFLQDIRKHSLPVDHEEEPHMKYSLNFKEKLEPIGRKLHTEDTSNRSSIFKRSTIKEPLLRPFPAGGKGEESLLESKRNRNPP
jgi:hypothetical protein